MSLLLRVSTNLVWADNLWRCHMKEMRKRDAMVHIGSQKSPTPKTGVGLGFAVFHCLSPLLTYRWTTNRVAHDRGNARSANGFFRLRSQLLGLGRDLIVQLSSLWTHCHRDAAHNRAVIIPGDVVADRSLHGSPPFPSQIVGLASRTLRVGGARSEADLECGAQLRGAQAIDLCVVIGTTASVQRCSLHGAEASRGSEIRRPKNCRWLACRWPGAWRRDRLKFTLPRNRRQSAVVA